MCVSVSEALSGLIHAIHIADEEVACYLIAF